MLIVPTCIAIVRAISPLLMMACSCFVGKGECICTRRKKHSYQILACGSAVLSCEFPPPLTNAGYPSQCKQGHPWLPVGDILIMLLMQGIAISWSVGRRYSSGSLELSLGRPLSHSLYTV